MDQDKVVAGVVGGSAAHLATGLARVGDLLALAAVKGNVFTAQLQHERAAQAVVLNSAPQAATAGLPSQLESSTPLGQGGPVAPVEGSSAAVTGLSGALAVELGATKRESVFVRWQRSQSQQQDGREVRTDKNNNDNKMQVRTTIHNDNILKDRKTIRHKCTPCVTKAINVKINKTTSINIIVTYSRKEGGCIKG